MTKICTNNLKIPVPSMVLTYGATVGLSLGVGALIKKCAEKTLSLLSNEKPPQEKSSIVKKFGAITSFGSGVLVGSVTFLASILAANILVLPKIQRNDLSISLRNKMYLGLGCLLIAGTLGTIAKERISQCFSSEAKNNEMGKWGQMRKKAIRLTSSGLGIAVGSVVLPFLVYNAKDLLKCCYLSGKFSFSTGIRTFSLIIDPIRGQLASNKFAGPIINVLARAPF